MDHPGNPLHEGANTAARGFAEMAVALAMLAEFLRRSREMADAAEAHRKLEDATRNELEQRRADANQQRWRARSATQWQLALDKGWMRTANVDEVVHVWAHSLPWQQEEVRAQQAKRWAEERLDRLDPGLMGRYHQRLEEGMDALTAMMDARREPGPPVHVERPAPDVAIELGPVPEVWEAGPVIAGALPRGEMLELEAAPAWPMGPIGWVDADRSEREAAADGEGVAATSRSAVATAAESVVETSEGSRASERVATYASSAAEARKRPFSRSAAARDRGAEKVANDGIARVRAHRR